MSEPENRVASAVDPHASEHTQADEDRLARAVGEYVDALEAGRHPDRQGLVDRYPEIAEELAASLDGIDFIHDVAPQLAGPAGKPARGSDQGIQPTLALGDFRIIRQIGKGGMGVVYEAEQLSLGRRMALKVLPFAAVLDPKQLQRFKNEAQAAASLKHPNIVGVHSVGCERGVHYYAMEFIEGRPLSEVIRDMRQIEGLEDGPPTEGGMLSQREALGEHVDAPDMPTPAPPVKACHPPAKPVSDPEDPTSAYQQVPASEASVDTVGQPQAAISTERSTKSPAYFRSIAEIGIQVAEALDHAHQHGVVHRDVKPANVLLDTEGKPWVTDFGLARVETGATLTISGDLLGTLRYMSPEQALAKRVVVDHRTDIYSLGVTLYELLTLRPAFSGRDRQEMLRQIAFEEPRPPRRLNASIPRELETIVLKATAKNPNDRYATAQELADDLKRFLEDKPIQARRPSLSTRAAKWSYRHRRPVAAATITAFAAVLVGLGLVWHGAQREGRQRHRAEKNLQLALDAMDQIYLQFAEDTLPGFDEDFQTKPITPEGKKLLREALEFYEQFARENEDEASVQIEVAKAYLRIGDIQGKLQMGDKALEAWTEAILRTLKLVRGTRPPRDPARLADGYAVIASAHKATASYLDRSLHSGGPGPGEALRYYDLAITTSTPRGRRGAHIYNERGSLYGGLSEFDKAIEDFTKAIELDPSNPAFYHKRGAAYSRILDFERALKDFDAALRLNPQDADALCRQGQCYLKTDEFDKAIAVCDAAILIDPRCASAYNNRGCVYYQQCEFDKAIVDLTEAIRLDPDSAAYHANRGMVYRSQGEFDKAIVDLTEAIRLDPDSAACHTNRGMVYRSQGEFDKAIADSSEAIRLDPDSAACHTNRGMVYRSQGEFDKAIADSSEAIRLDPRDARAYECRGASHRNLGELQKALADSSEAIRLDVFQAHAYIDRAETNARLGRIEDAFGDIAKVLGLGVRTPRAAGNLAWRLANCEDPRLRRVDRAVQLARQSVQETPACGDFWTALGAARYRAGDWKAALEALNTATELKCYRVARREFFNAMAHGQLGHEQEARRAYDQAIEWMQQKQPKSPELGRLRAEAAELLGIESEQLE